MTRVSVSELKANLSRYLREIRRGGEVEVLDRGVAVARLTGLPQVSSEAAEERRGQLIKAGILKPGTNAPDRLLELLPLEIACDLSAAVELERADRP